MTEQNEHPEQKSRAQLRKAAPVQVRMLEYAPPDESKQAKRRKHMQFAAGMAAPYLYGVLFTLAAASVNGVSSPMAELAVVAFIVGVVCVHTMTSWKAFLPGVLTGVFVIPLALAGLCAIIVAGMSAMHR